MNFFSSTSRIAALKTALLNFFSISICFEVEKEIKNGSVTYD